jgi:DNA topoisomerase-1
MAKKLLIVESPAKAKTISKYLDGEYTVMASVGHIRDLPKSSKNAVDIEGGFVPHYVISPGKEHIVDDIKRAAKDADEILLAPDPDREGEAIAWHIKEAAKLKKTKRIVFHEITRDAVREAIKHPREIDIDLKEAQEARRVLDRLFGYDLSGLIWKKLRYGLSAGRVQSPALRILMEREREIRAFVPETFWTLVANLKLPSGDVAAFECSEEPRDRKQVDDILTKGRAGDWSLTDIVETDVERSARAPFTTSTLQQAASSRLGYSPSRTMGVAQKLYESGAITYMRTDSVTLSKIALGQASNVITKMFGEKYVAIRQYAGKSKNAQEAHEAIRPTDLSKKSAGNNPEQKALYDLIWSRTVSSQMTAAKLKRTKFVANIKTADIPDFHVTGSRILFDGWLAADPGARGEDVILPKASKGDSLKLVDLTDTEKQTQPPSRYSEAGLVKELEKRGIGRPSTYASIIKTLIDREYVTKEGKALKPTDTGDAVSSFLEEHFASYISDEFTAEMEDNLDQIAEGKRAYVATLKDFYGPFKKAVASKKDVERINYLEVADAKFKCPKCGSGMVVKLGRGGKFLSCDRFPDCDGALTEEGLEIKPDEPIGIHPETNLPIFMKVGRFGPYVQMGVTVKANKKEGIVGEKARMASIPKEKDLASVTLADAVKYLSLPRRLGEHPVTGKVVTTNIGRFGPYVVHDGDFRSIKEKDGDSPYTITFERAMEIISQPKKVSARGRFGKKGAAPTIEGTAKDTDEKPKKAAAKKKRAK